jgi:LCP family protein required for cell wall assembly
MAGRGEGAHVARWHLFVKLAIGLVGVAAVIGLVAGVGIYVLFGDTERVDFDPERGRAALPPGQEAEAPAAPLDPDSSRFESFLVLGSDTREGLGGERADVIMVALLPSDGDPVLFSLPRDLWLHNACSGGMSRINAGLNGCGEDVSGPEMMAIMVEDFTGLAIDHYVRVDFDGFTDVIDTVGGVRICNDHPIRDWDWELPEGCVLADGEETLNWVRSRTTQEYVDGGWRTMPGTNDLMRNQRQQEVLLQLMEGIRSVRSPAALRPLADTVSESVQLSRSLSMPRGISLAWGARDLGRDDIRRFTIPVTDHVTSGGAMVLLPVEEFATTFAREVDGGERLVSGG